MLVYVNRLLQDRCLEAFDGSRFLSAEKYDKLKDSLAFFLIEQSRATRGKASKSKEEQRKNLPIVHQRGKQDREQRDALCQIHAEKLLSLQKIYRVHPSFRVVGLAAYPTNKNPWLSNEVK